MMKALVAVVICMASVAASAQVWAQQVPPASKQSETSVAELMPPEHPCTPAQVRQLLQITGVDAMTHRMMDKLLGGMQKTANPVIPSSVWDEMREGFAHFDLIKAVIPAYQRYLSQEDLTYQIEFYQTPTGKRILASQPFIAAVSADAGKQAGEEIGRQAIAHHKDEIEARQKQLDKEAAARAGSVQLEIAPSPAAPSVKSARPTDTVSPK